jgi:hypothetical protein
MMAMVVMAAILVASPVLAAGSSSTAGVRQVAKKWKKPTVISMTGTVLALGVDPDTNAKEAIKIDIRMTNRAFIEYRGKIKWVDTTPTTLYILWDGKTREYITYDDLKVGDKISINARVYGEVFKARRVQAYQPRIPQ